MNENDIFNFENIDIKEFDSKKFMTKLILALQYVLDEKFGNNSVKSRITTNYKSINCSCPYCGDGKGVKHRFHVYYKNYSIKCYNDCSKGFTSLYNFLKDFNISERFDQSELIHIKSIFDASMENYQGMGGSSNINQISGGSTIINLNEKTGANEIIQKKPEIDEYAFPREEIIKERKLREITKSQQAIEYLLKRKIIKSPMDVYDHSYPEFLFNDYYQDLYILNLASNKKDILGIQIRHLSEKSRRRFTSITWGDIWKDIFKMCPDNEEELRAKFDKMSMMWNILHINYNKPFFILEGAIDAYCMNENSTNKNAIACLGLSNFIYNYSGYYITDNTLEDSAGKKTAMKLIYEGYNTFLWGKFFYDKNYSMFSKCKDINDIIKLDPNFNFDVFKNYFSNEPLDSIFL